MVSIVATAYNIRYGSANTEVVTMDGCGTGVEAMERPETGDGMASVADNAGDGIRSDEGMPAKTGDGETIGERLGVGMECLCGEAGAIGAELEVPTPRSRSTVSSLPFSSRIVFGSSKPITPCRNS